MSIFQRKPISTLIEESREEGAHTLRKTLGAWKLTALGLGAIIGAGLFSITGMAAGAYAGPAITISFLIAAAGCCFAGLCYAEFASMLPVAGSAYTYSYATLGEFIAWVIGWDLMLEYAVGALTVSISFSQYLVKFLEGINIHIPEALTYCPADGGIVNLPAAIVIVILSLLLISGTERSSWVNSFIVILKISIVVIFIMVGWKFINTENYIPYIPENTGTWGQFGFSGVIRAAAVVFFAFIGFDAVSTAAQEAKNPKRNMPIGILGSLLLCTILYVLFSHVLTGVAHYTLFQGKESIAPVAIAVDNMGAAMPDGSIMPTYPWLNKAIILAILAGYSSVILVMLLGQSRVFYSMSRDGLLPKVFSEVHTKYRTPFKTNILFMILVGILAMFVPARIAGELTSIGTLFAFIIVCIGVWTMRRRMPDAPRAFKTPLVPLVPLLGIAICLFMMIYLPFDTWIRLILWMMFGHDIYVFYGSRHSKLGAKTASRLLSVIGLSIPLLLIGFVIANHTSAGHGSDSSLIFPAILILIATFHIVLYGIRLLKGRNK
ncbi:MAG: amino acid permease [Dysgonamonadaceae bacterium]|jgi:APA family basic amino acid/polyamine antiporter|nr:amino acid permease [Dysgonamonadaceae bacterium]